MEWDIIIKIGSFALTAAAIGLGIIQWMLDRGQKYTAGQFAELRKDMDAHSAADMNEHKAFDARIAAHDTRLTRAEQDIKNNPGHNDLGRVFRRIEDVRGEMKEISGSMKSLTRSVDMINEHLISREGK